MNSVSNTAATIPSEAADCYANYAGFALTLGEAFLILALLVALVETALALWAKLQAARKGPEAVQKGIANPAVDPVKLLEALKAILDALKGLPSWIAIFLAGLALLWMVGQEPKACSTTNASKACKSESTQSGSPTAPAPASNAQATPNTK
jgi:hypothetical protein